MALYALKCNHLASLGLKGLSLWWDSPMFWAPWHQSMSTYSQFHPKDRWVWRCKLSVISQEWLKVAFKLLLSANRKWCMPCRLAQQRMTLTLSDLEMPFHASRAISAVAELLVCFGLVR